MSINSEFFPSDIIQAAQDAQSSTGCPASVALAQWAQESGFGKYQMQANNPFGMKWYPTCPYPFVTRLTKEWERNHYVAVEAKFIAFPSAKEAFEEHGKLLMNPKGPYAAANRDKNVWRKFVEVISPIYATDPHYCQELISLIEIYRLDEADIGSS